jgi:hypothetical protein
MFLVGDAEKCLFPLFKDLAQRAHNQLALLIVESDGGGNFVKNDDLLSPHDLSDATDDLPCGVPQIASPNICCVKELKHFLQVFGPRAFLLKFLEERKREKELHYLCFLLLIVRNVAIMKKTPL